VVLQVLFQHHSQRLNEQTLWFRAQRKTRQPAYVSG
jgi:hypothetical protein